MNDVGGVARVNSNLNLSRAIGDLKYKLNANLPPEQQVITAHPDVRVFELTDSDKFFILACDGIWDVLSNEVRSLAQQQSTPTLTLRCPSWCITACCVCISKQEHAAHTV